MITARIIFIITCMFRSFVASLIMVGQARKRAKIRAADFFRVSALILVVLFSAGILPPTADGISSNLKTVAAANPKRSLRVKVTRPDHRSYSRTFHVALVCDTDASRTGGLQGFRRLKTNEAALFVFEKPSIVSFWMGSVAYPIDIIFVSPVGEVVRVYPNCKPGSRDIYPSVERTRWVIETAAGSKIRTGDRVRIEGLRVKGQGKKP